jgi:hypothetical protein
MDNRLHKGILQHDKITSAASSGGARTRKIGNRVTPIQAAAKGSVKLLKKLFSFCDKECPYS